MKKVILSVAIAATFLTLSCTENNSQKQVESTETTKSENPNEHEGHNHGVTSEKETRTIEESTVKNNSTTAILDAYLLIKNALVNDDKDGAAKGGTALLDAFSKFDMTQLTENQHKEYMEILENAKEHAEHIVKSPIDHQREHFEDLSTDINDIVRLVGTDKTLYQDFCPMANDGKGAIWLSEIKDIKNPFYGSKMLKCGEVQKQIN
jgi:hypothetical protein